MGSGVSAGERWEGVVMSGGCPGAGPGLRRGSLSYILELKTALINVVVLLQNINGP